MKKMRIYIISIISLLFLWFLLYLVIDHSLVLPSPIDVFEKFFSMLLQSKTYLLTLLSGFRLLISIFISAVLGVLFALLSYFYAHIKLFMKPYVTILRTIPVISIVVILLIILGFTWTPYVITFFMVFPIIYQGTLHGLESINTELIDVIKLEQRHLLPMIFGFYLPQIKASIFLAFLQSFGLGLKVLVMAEYLAQTKNSIGNELYLAKVNLLYDEVFAWTIILIVISVIIEYFIQKKMKQIHSDDETKIEKKSMKMND
ncbi:MAG: ABC transporter permease subunit [Bacillota bacterium]|nr:MAG: ABC transporter permease subunit [Bacillota bacterium]